MVGLADPVELEAPGAAEPGLRFRLAAQGDDAELRRLLRENPMRGDVQLSMEREPDFFAGAGIEGDEHRTVVAEESNRLVCLGSVSSRHRYVNGARMRVGYLGGLRLDAGRRNRVSILRGGFELFRRLHDAGGPPIYLTSIVEDNVAARRLLERGLPGMPTYRFVGNFVTLVVRRRRVRPRLRECGRRIEDGGETALPEVAELLDRTAMNYQFAPAWSEDEIRSGRCCPGLSAGDFRVVRSADGSAVACAALWDQGSVKQIVVRGYSPRVRRLRPLLNVAALLVGRPRLPPLGRQMKLAFVSHLVADPRRPEMVELLVNLLHGPARTRGIDYLTLGFDARDERLPYLRRVFRPREYRSRLYAVHWDDEGAAVARGLDDRLLAPEVALL